MYSRSCWSRTPYSRMGYLYYIKRFLNATVSSVEAFAERQLTFATRIATITTMGIITATSSRVINFAHRVIVAIVGPVIGSTQLKFNVTKIRIAVVKSIEASGSRTKIFADRIVTSTVSIMTASISRVITFADRIVHAVVKPIVSYATSYIWYAPWLTGIVTKFDSLKGRKVR